MPALVNKRVGSFFTTIGAEGTMVCPLDLKNSRNCCRIAALVIIYQMFIWVDFCYLWAYICKLLFNGGKGKEKRPHPNPSPRERKLEDGCKMVVKDLSIIAVKVTTSLFFCKGHEKDQILL
jgi:hypothetical protein